MTQPNCIQNQYSELMKRILILASLCTICLCGFSQSQTNSPKEIVLFDFNGSIKEKSYQFSGEGYSFGEGIDKKSLLLQSKEGFSNLKLENLSLDGKESFTVQFWVKTISDNPTVFLSQKNFSNKGILSQKNKGWALYSSGGTFAWTIGSGERRLTYERDNGDKMPISDGEWHQLTMTFNKELAEMRLYYDGYNKAIYKLGFDFQNESPLIIGTQESGFDYNSELLPSIKEGKKQLQDLVDAFNKVATSNVTEEEFFSLIVDPKELYIRKLNLNKAEAEKTREQELALLDEVFSIRKGFYDNPYTVHQNSELTALKPVSKLYSLQDGVVSINQFYAKKFGMEERLYPSNFSMDNLTIWDRAISSDEVATSYTDYKKAEPIQLANMLDRLTVAVWNIWHGGTHWSTDKDGWDSRLRIVEILKKRNADIILMQETYSSGDFIAAELGYYFATTSDWDYCSQGSNISVLSRYPIKELEVPTGAEFMNVAVKLALSETQDVYAMSNWYGMSSFPVVYDFHSAKFDNADEIPILFGGDFNAIPHTDGGDSEASIKMLENGFADAFRSTHPDVELFKGYTHQWGERIDQLYYKGKGLSNTSTEVISTAFGGFPSDHFIILSKFALQY